MNAIELLKEQHRQVEGLFAKLERTSRGKDSVAEEILRQITIHTAIEEQAFYPAVRRLVPALGELVLESFEEHTVVKWEIASLAMMDAKNERFDAKMKVLRDLFMHHVDEEEHQLFPQLQKAVGADKLDQIGDQLEQAQEGITSGRRRPRQPVRRQPAAPKPTVRRGAQAGARRAATKSSSKRGARGARSRSSR